MHARVRGSFSRGYFSGITDELVFLCPRSDVSFICGLFISKKVNSGYLSSLERGGFSLLVPLIRLIFFIGRMRFSLLFWCKITFNRKIESFALLWRFLFSRWGINSRWAIFVVYFQNWVGLMFMFFKFSFSPSVLNVYVGWLGVRIFSLLEKLGSWMEVVSSFARVRHSLHEDQDIRFGSRFGGSGQILDESVLP